ncbi:MAG: HWE histidine kinase domain-containing protein [Parvibaculum sp.]
MTVSSPSTGNAPHHPPPMMAGFHAASHDGGMPGRGEDGADTYRLLFEALDQGVCVIEMLFDGAGRPFDYRFLQVNPSFTAQTGLHDAVGRTMRSFREDHEQHWFDIYGEVVRSGEPVRFENEAAALGRWYDVYAFRIGAPELRRVGVVFSDITKRRHEEEQIALRTAELGHRMKNMLTVLSSIVRMTRAETVSDYRDILLGRIRALANSQRFLLEARRQHADLAQIVEDEMKAYQAAGEARVTWRGAHATLDPGVAQTVAMALHELATNAAKYGALSTPEGRVAIKWRREADGLLGIRWTEQGGPAIAAAPAREGIGTSIILQGARERRRKGETVFDWRPEGLVCRLAIPVVAVGG